VDQAEEFKDWERRKEEEIYTFNVRGKSLISEEDRTNMLLVTACLDQMVGNSTWNRVGPTHEVTSRSITYNYVRRMIKEDIFT